MRGAQLFPLLGVMSRCFFCLVCLKLLQPVPPALDKRRGVRLGGRQPNLSCELELGAWWGQQGLRTRGYPQARLSSAFPAPREQHILSWGRAEDPGKENGFSPFLKTPFCC